MAFELLYMVVAQSMESQSACFDFIQYEFRGKSQQTSKADDEYMKRPEPRELRHILTTNKNKTKKTNSY